MAKETPAEAAARFRKIAEDPKLPQAVRNTYLDKANAAEKEAAKPTMAKGGVVKSSKAPAKGAMKKPSVAIMIAVGKPKDKMAKGGMAKKGCK
jgi:hypothetical protein